MYRWHGIGLMGVGIVLVLLVSRGSGRPPPRRAANGPDFAAADPEVAELPPPTTGHLGERIRQVRERRKRAEE
jgi:hypothetical protein